MVAHVPDYGLYYISGVQLYNNIRTFNIMICSICITQFLYIFIRFADVSITENIPPGKVPVTNT